MLQNTELETIREASTFNEEQNEYKVPAFYLKNKEIVFPKLQQQQSVDMIRQMQEGRQIQLEDKENTRSKDLMRENKRRKSRDLGLSDILK